FGSCVNSTAPMAANPQIMGSAAKAYQPRPGPFLAARLSPAEALRSIPPSVIIARDYSPPSGKRQRRWPKRRSVAICAPMAARPPLVAPKAVRLQAGPRPLFDGVDMAMEPRSRAALVGRNGAGKSTLMKVVMGLIEPDSGDRSVQAGTRFAYVPQEPVITG